MSSVLAPSSPPVAPRVDADVPEAKDSPTSGATSPSPAAALPPSSEPVFAPSPAPAAHSASTEGVASAAGVAGPPAIPQRPSSAASVPPAAAPASSASSSRSRAPSAAEKVPEHVLDPAAVAKAAPMLAQLDPADFFHAAFMGRVSEVTEKLNLAKKIPIKGNTLKIPAAYLPPPLLTQPPQPLTLPPEPEDDDPDGPDLLGMFSYINEFVAAPSASAHDRTLPPSLGAAAQLARMHDPQSGKSLIQIAVERPIRPLIPLLYAAGADINAPGPDGRTAVHSAVKLNQCRLVKTWLDELVAFAKQQGEASAAAAAAAAAGKRTPPQKRGWENWVREEGPGDASWREHPAITASKAAAAAAAAAEGKTDPAAGKAGSTGVLDYIEELPEELPEHTSSGTGSAGEREGVDGELPPPQIPRLLLRVPANVPNFEYRDVSGKTPWEDTFEPFIERYYADLRAKKAAEEADPEAAAAAAAAAEAKAAEEAAKAEKEGKDGEEKKEKKAPSSRYVWDVPTVPRPLKELRKTYEKSVLNPIQVRFGRDYDSGDGRDCCQTCTIM